MKPSAPSKGNPSIAGVKAAVSIKCKRGETSVEIAASASADAKQSLLDFFNPGNLMKIFFPGVGDDDELVGLAEKLLLNKPRQNRGRKKNHLENENETSESESDADG